MEKQSLKYKLFSFTIWNEKFIINIRLRNKFTRLIK